MFNAVGGAASDAEIGGGNKGLHLHQNGPRSLHTDDDGGAGGILAAVGEEDCGRVGDFQQALAMHLEDADFVRGAKTILDAAQQAVGVVAFAFEVENGVGDVFQGFGTGNGAFFGDVADDEDGDMAAFGKLHQLQGAFAYLADAARRGWQMTGQHRLNRVDDDQRGFEAGNSFGDDLQFDGGQQIEPFAADIQPFSAHFDLLNRFLT